VAPAAAVGGARQLFDNQITADRLHPSAAITDSLSVVDDRLPLPAPVCAPWHGWNL